MIRLKIVSLLRKKVDLNEIVLRHPVVNLMVRKDGSTNLPTPPKSDSNTSTSPFDLGIQHVLIERGEIYYNDVKTPLDAELHDLQLEIKSEFLRNGYDGSLSYRNGRLQYGDMKPLPHDLTTSFNATPSQFTLKPLLLTVASSTIRLEGDVKDYSHPSAKGTYQITIHPQDFRSVLSDPSVPTGEVTLAGSLRYDYEANVPMLRAVVLDGHLNGRELAINSPQLRAVIRNVGGEFKLANGNFDARGLKAELLGGTFSAAATMQHLDANPVSKLHASLQRISLGAAKAAFSSASIKQIPISGHIDGMGDADWTGSLKDIRARSTIVLKAALSSASSGSAPVPLTGPFMLTTKAGQGWRCGQYVCAHAADTCGYQWRRRSENESARDIHAADLREMDSLAAAFQTSGTSKSTNTASRSSINLAGVAELEVLVAGTVNDPRIEARLNRTKPRGGKYAMAQLGAWPRASKSGISIENGSLVNARQGYVNFSLNTALSNWHYTASSPVTAQVMSRGLGIKQLLEIAKLDYPSPAISPLTCPCTGLS